MTRDQVVVPIATDMDVAALREFSPEAAPFLKLFSSTGWRVLLCADDDRLTPDRVLDALAFVGWPKRSVVPDALRRSVRAFDKDSLRRFLVFATGSPGLPQLRAPRCA